MFLRRVCLVLVLFLCMSGSLWANENSGECDCNSLPESVYLRTDTETFNEESYAVLCEGRIYVKNKNAADWTELAFPDESVSGFKRISWDDLSLVAESDGGWIYTYTRERVYSPLGKDSYRYKWIDRWGPPLWMGSGRTIPDDTIDWDLSVLSPRKGHDEFWTDDSGQQIKVGDGKVHTIYALRGDGSKITILDPWLPNDNSVELGTPYAGKFQAVGLSASGSTVFITNRYGDMYTRLWDFDIAGMDTAFFDYYYGNEGYNKPLRISTYLAEFYGYEAIKLPSPPWVKQPRIQLSGDAYLTDRISIHKTGAGDENRVLRVEGADEYGAAGYYEKIYDSEWHFIALENYSLKGNMLEYCPDDCSGLTFSESKTTRYVMGARGWAAEIPDFYLHKDTHTLRIYVENSHFDLILHSRDKMRQTERAEGLDHSKRKLLGAIVVPENIDDLISALQSEDARYKAEKIIENYFSRSEPSCIEIDATSNMLRIDTSRRDANTLIEPINNWIFCVPEFDGGTYYDNSFASRIDDFLYATTGEISTGINGVVNFFIFFSDLNVRALLKKPAWKGDVRNHTPELKQEKN